MSFDLLYRQNSKKMITVIELSFIFSSISRKRFVCILFISFFFQQYVMLHDMVATHSTVRVSVCRVNEGKYIRGGLKE